MPAVKPAAGHKLRFVVNVSSEGLSNAEEEIPSAKGFHGVIFPNRVPCRIEVVAHVTAHWPHRRMVANTQPNRLRVVGEVAAQSGVRRSARCDRRLLKPRQTADDLAGRGEKVAQS